MCFVVFRFPDQELLGGTEATTVFIGGLSADLIIPYDKSRDYIGCMRDFFVNGQRVHLSDANQDRRRLDSHNVEDGCDLDTSRSCGAKCESEGCINYLSNSSPYCDCTLSTANCTVG